MSHHLVTYETKRNAEPLTEMKRRHFIMLAKGREDMRLFVSSLGLSPTTDVVVEVEKAFYLDTFDGNTLGLEGDYEEGMHQGAKHLVLSLTAHDQDIAVKRQAILNYLAFVNDGREGGDADAAMTQVVTSFLDAMRETYQALPSPMHEEGRTAVLDELSKWAPRLSRCGMSLADAQDRVLRLSP